MGFFTSHQKNLAKKFSTEALEYGYHKSEDNLRKASQIGDTKLLKQEMKKHGNYEYALLYKNTPEYKRKQK
jgi:hypothetical protein